MFVTYVHTRSEHIAHIFIRKFSITSTGIRKNYCNGSVKFMTGKRVDRFGPPCQTQSEMPQANGLHIILLTRRISVINRGCAFLFLSHHYRTDAKNLPCPLRKCFPFQGICKNLLSAPAITPPRRRSITYAF